MEHVNGSEDILEIDIVVRCSGLLAVDGIVSRVDIQRQVDASVRELLHALIMVLCVVDGIDTDGVDAQLLELLDVALAVAIVGNRVLRVRRAAWKSRSVTVSRLCASSQRGTNLAGNQHLGRRSACRLLGRMLEAWLVAG